MPCVIILSVIMKSVIMLGVVMLGVVMLNVLVTVSINDSQHNNIECHFAELHYFFLSECHCAEGYNL